MRKTAVRMTQGDFFKATTHLKEHHDKYKHMTIRSICRKIAREIGIADISEVSMRRCATIAGVQIGLGRGISDTHFSQKQRSLWKRVITLETNVKNLCKELGIEYQHYEENEENEEKQATLFE